MAWGKAAATGLQDLVARLQSNDPKLTTLTVLRQRRFGHEVRADLATGRARMAGAAPGTARQSSNNLLLPGSAISVCAPRHWQPAPPRKLRRPAPLLWPATPTHRSDKARAQDVAALCQALSTNTVLQELYASSHAMAPATAALLADALAANTTLKGNKRLPSRTGRCCRPSCLCVDTCMREWPAAAAAAADPAPPCHS